MALWAIPVLHILPAILYVRARLRLEKNKPASLIPVLAAHLVALVVGGALAVAGLIPYLTTLALLILLARAGYGLSAYQRPVTTKAIGWSEMALTLLVVMLTAVGFWLLV